MVIAWMMCCTTAVLLAKYYKPMWPNDELCGTDVWFSVSQHAAEVCCSFLSKQHIDCNIWLRRYFIMLYGWLTLSSDEFGVLSVLCLLTVGSPRPSVCDARLHGAGIHPHLHSRRRLQSGKWFRQYRPLLLGKCLCCANINENTMPVARH